MHIAKGCAVGGLLQNDVVALRSVIFPRQGDGAHRSRRHLDVRSASKVRGYGRSNAVDVVFDVEVSVFGSEGSVVGAAFVQAVGVLPCVGDTVAVGIGRPVGFAHHAHVVVYSVVCFVGNEGSFFSV